MDGNMRKSERLRRAEQLRRRALVDGEPPAGSPVAAAGSIVDVKMGADRVYDVPREWLEAEWRRLRFAAPEAPKRLWTPSPGRNVIRVLPLDGEEGFYVEAPSHGYVGPRKRTVPCRSRIAQPCYVCERVEELAASPARRDQERAATLQVRYSYLVHIIDHNDPGCGVQVWTTDEEMILKFLALMVDPNWRDLLDPKTGRTVTFFRWGDGPASYYSDLRPSPHPRPIGYPGWRDELKNLREYWPLPSYLEQQRIYEGGRRPRRQRGEAPERQRGTGV